MKRASVPCMRVYDKAVVQTVALVIMDQCSTGSASGSNMESDRSLRVYWPFVGINDVDCVIAEHETLGPAIK